MGGIHQDVGVENGYGDALPTSLTKIPPLPRAGPPDLLLQAWPVFGSLAMWSQETLGAA